MNRAADDHEPAAGADDLERDLLEISEELDGLLMLYGFGLEEMLSKINILQQELRHAGASGSPIEHVSHRLKRPSSIIEKARRLGCASSAEEVRSGVWDIAGIRIVCSFVEDAYAVLDMLRRQPDVTVVQVKDYIARPKPSGYKSLHLIVDIPVFLSTRTELVRAEIQIRTVAMDFWASLEHKIHYKYPHEVPQMMREELVRVAMDTDRLDQQMEQLHRDSRDPIQDPDLRRSRWGPRSLGRVVAHRDVEREKLGPCARTRAPELVSSPRVDRR